GRIRRCSQSRPQKRGTLVGWKKTLHNLRKANAFQTRSARQSASICRVRPERERDVIDVIDVIRYLHYPHPLSPLFIQPGYDSRPITRRARVDIIEYKNPVYPVYRVIFHSVFLTKFSRENNEKNKTNPH